MSGILSDISAHETCARAAGAGCALHSPRALAPRRISHLSLLPPLRRERRRVSERGKFEEGKQSEMRKRYLPIGVKFGAGKEKLGCMAGCMLARRGNLENVNVKLREVKIGGETNNWLRHRRILLNYEIVAMSERPTQIPGT